MKQLAVALVAAITCVYAHTSKAENLSQVRSWAAACANCHGTDGRAQPGIEGLAGVNKDDIVKKMKDFKSGRKPATIMHQLSKGYSDEQIEQIAAYFAAQSK
jgi:cytochrome subunit of sulfide dehydrogenase